MKVTQKMIDEKELELASNNCKINFELTMADVNFIRGALQRYAEFQKECAIETSKKSYWNATEKAEQIAKRGESTMLCEILCDKIWNETDLYEGYIKPIRDLERELED